MIEFAVLLLVAAAAAAYIALPRPGAEPAGPALDDLRARRDELLRELADLDDDAAAGRISPGDRAAGRRALAPHLRAVTEALREHGEPAAPLAPAQAAPAQATPAQSAPPGGPAGHGERTERDAVARRGLDTAP